MIIADSNSDRTLTYQATGMPAYVGVARNRWTITAVDQQRTQAAFEASNPAVCEPPDAGTYTPGEEGNFVVHDAD